MHIKLNLFIIISLDPIFSHKINELEQNKIYYNMTYKYLSKNLNKIINNQYTAIILFVLLLLSFISMGLFNAYNYSVTIDEPAHLGAAESYRWHEGVNPEHPPLMKALNGLLIRLQFPDYKTITPNQYGKGAEFLWLSKYDPNTVLMFSRLVYLVTHTIIFLWFWYYTFFRKIISKSFSLIFLTLFVFSPTVITINPLLIFDIAGAIGAFIAVFSSILLMFNLSILTGKTYISDTIVTGFSIGFALLTKFTNLYLIPVFIIILTSTLVDSYRQKMLIKNWKKLILTIGLILSIVLTNIWIVYNYAYKNLPYNFTTNIGIEKKLFIPFFRMYDGALWIYNYVQVTPKPNFVDNKYAYITYQQFINRAFWFKENPIIIILLLLCVIFIIWVCLKKVNLFKQYFTLKNILISISSTAFPFIYFLFAKDKFFAIGFRHFLSIEIFIFAGIAALLYFFSTQKSRFNIFVALILIIYSIFGVLSLQKGVGYTNLLWQSPNWKLANDSTVFLAEYQKKPLEYLYSIGQLKPQNNGDVTFIIRGHWITQQMAIYQITGSKDDRYGSYNVGLDPISERISDSKAKYLVVDIFWFHEILDNITTKNNGIAIKNLEYLQNTKPMYNHNNAIFIYNLN